MTARLSASEPALSLLEGGRREPPTGIGQPAVANTLRLGGEHAWGVAKGGDAGERQHAAKDHGDQQEQGGRLADKAAGKTAISVIVGKGRQGPSAR